MTKKAEGTPETRAQGARLEEARKAAGFKSRRAPAVKYKWGVSSYSAHERGTRTIGKDDAERYSRKFRPAGAEDLARYILFGGKLPQKGRLSDIVRVVGRIGAGALIEPDVEQVPTGGLFRARAKELLMVPSEAMGFLVVGDSMFTIAADGDLIVCPRQLTNVEEFINAEVALQTVEGRRYIKRVRAGSESGLYNLESRNSSAVIEDVQIDWVAKIASIVKAGEWEEVDD